MIALNIEQLKLLSVQAQLQQLCTTVLENKNMLDHWQDYIDEYRSLQMDDMIIVSKKKILYLSSITKSTIYRMTMMTI
jgi:hypothetical protein